REVVALEDLAAVLVDRLPHFPHDVRREQGRDQWVGALADLLPDAGERDVEPVVAERLLPRLRVQIPGDYNGSVAVEGDSLRHVRSLRKPGSQPCNWRTGGREWEVAGLLWRDRVRPLTSVGRVEEALRRGPTPATNTTGCIRGWRRASKTRPDLHDVA